MSKLIQLIQKKPTDKTIRLVRVGFALILLFVITFGIQKTHWEYTTIPAELISILYVFPLLGLIRGILDPGIWRRKIWKWTIFGLGISMMVISLFLIQTDMTETNLKMVVPSTATGISLDHILQSETALPFIVDTDFWIGFLGFFVAIIGFALTSKNITKKNERYGERVTKIRV